MPCWINNPFKNTVMKKLTRIVQVFLMVMLLSFAFRSVAQQGGDMKQVQDQMKKAQELIKKQMGDKVPQLLEAMKKAQAQIDQANRQLDSTNKTLPADKQIPAGNTRLSDMKMADPAKMIGDINKNLEKNMAALTQAQANRAAHADNNLPAMVVTAKSSALPALNDSTLQVLVKQLLVPVTKSLDSANHFLHLKLDGVIKDVKVDVPATGIAFFTIGVPKYVSRYLICKGALAKPHNAWALNNLGIMLRDMKKYKQAIPVFKRALNFSKSDTIQVNMGWAMAYFGDFNGAKVAFNAALAVDPEFTPAYEGLATVAYKQGDRLAVFACLLKEIKGFGKKGKKGPSPAFVDLAESISDQQTMDQMGKPSAANPEDDHTYDNPDGDEGNEEVTENNTEEMPNYPSMGGFFAQDVDHVTQNNLAFLKNYQVIKTAIAASRANVAARQSGLTRLHTAPKYDDEGNRVGTYNYERHYKIFHRIHVQFEERVSYIHKQFDEEMDPLMKNITLQNADMVRDYLKELQKCTNEDCVNAVNCIWIPKLHNQASTNLGAVSAVWTRFFKRMIDNANWYIGASSPFIKRMAQDDWNKYMNAIREDDCRQARLGLYTKWLPAQACVSAGLDPYLPLYHTLNCIIPVREIQHGTDPSTVKTKKLLTYPDYCDPKVSTYQVPFGAGNFDSSCSGWSISIGSDEASAFFGKSFGKHKEEDTNRAGISLGISKDIGGTAGGIELKGSVGATVKLGYDFDNHGNMVDKFVELEGTAGVSGKATTGNDVADKTLGLPSGSAGVKLGVTFKALMGPDHDDNDWHVTDVSAGKH
jgi:tetratricopeptide (TPR) repeat protein